MHSVNHDVGGSINSKGYSTPFHTKPSFRTGGLSDGWKRALIIIGIVVTIVAFVWLMLYFRYRPARVAEDALWQYERVLNGETTFAKNQAPAQYWTYLGKRNNTSANLELKKAKDEWYGSVRALKNTYKDYRISLDIVDQQPMNAADNKMLMACLRNVGIVAADVGGCQKLTVLTTITTSSDRGAQITETYYAVQINGVWYLLYQPLPSTEYRFVVNRTIFPTAR